eukprot:389291_1
MGRRKFVYKKIQTLKSIVVKFESWTSSDVAQYIMYIFQTTKSDDFKKKLKNEILEQNVDGKQMQNLQQDDIECLLDENDYKNNTTEYERDVQLIYDAIETIDEQSHDEIDPTQQIKVANVNRCYKLWTTEDIIKWVCSFKQLSHYNNAYDSQLQQLLKKCRVNGYNITKYKKKDIMKQWNIKRIEDRKFIYTQIQKLRDIKIKFETWSTRNVAQYIVSIFQNDHKKSYTFTQKLEKTIIEQEINGKEMLDLQEDDIECVLDEKYYEQFDVFTLREDRQRIYEAIKGLYEKTEFRYAAGYCKQKETLVNNCLVIFFGIRMYDNDIKLDKYRDLDVHKDKEYFEETFKDDYAYKFIPNDIDKPQYPNDVERFLQQVRNRYLWHGEMVHHNGLIVCIAGHGSNHHFICSNGEKVSLQTIRAIFSDSVHLYFKHLPKVYIINCCRDENGEQQLPRGVNKDNKPGTYSATLLPTSESNKVFSAEFAQKVAKSFSQHKDKRSKLYDICKSIKDIHGEMILSEYDMGVGDVRFTKNNNNMKIINNIINRETKNNEDSGDDDSNEQKHDTKASYKISAKVQYKVKHDREKAFRLMCDENKKIDWESLYIYIATYGQFTPVKRKVKEFFDSMKPDVHNLVTFGGFTSVIGENGDVIAAFTNTK